MPGTHRNTDSRSCGARTIVVGQSSVFVNGLLWSVNGDPNNHGNGNLIASINNVLIEGKAPIIRGDSARPDNLDHINPSASGASGDVFSNGG